MTQPFRSCPICQEAETESLHAMSFTLPAGSPLPESYDLVACRNCGFVYANTVGTRDAYALHYTNFSLYEETFTSTSGHTNNEDSIRFNQIASLIALRLPRQSRILDIGCGNGGLLMALRKQGFENLTGMDPSERCISGLRKLGIKAMQASVDTIPYFVELFDLVILSHVMEHLLEPLVALNALKKLLTPDGKVYMETPDASRYPCRPFVPYYFFDSEHINHFDQTSLINLASAAGLKTELSEAKEIPVKGGLSYPAAFCIVASNPRTHPAELINDTKLRQAVSEYIAESTDRSTRFTLLEQAIGISAPIAIWGAGSYAQRFMQLPWISNHEIVAVVDKDPKKAGREFSGCTITAPYQGLQNIHRDTVVLILVALDAQSAAQEYLRLGLPNRYIIGTVE